MSALLRARRSNPRPNLTSESASLSLMLLREVALECRTAPRCSPQEACALVAPEANAVTFARALLQALPDLLRRRPVIWRPGSAGQSFDESWLMAIEAAAARRDADSLRFLTERRLRPGATEAFLFLVRGLMTRLDEV
ncbi:MAG: hypothetical protein AAGF30_15385 [Pseudomonadota bacterium]